MTRSTNRIPEPPRTDDDTNPSWVIRKLPSASPVARVARVLLLVAAVALTLGAALIYIQQGNQPAVTPIPPQVVVLPNGAPTDLPRTATVSPTGTPRPAPVIAGNDAPAPDVLGALMLEAPDNKPVDNLLYRQQNAFTIAPARPRSSALEYRVQVGDTVEKIAKRFNISQDSIIWNNDITYINLLGAGTPLTIPPIDGILYKPASNESIQQIADRFKVSPYAIIDSEYNKLSAAKPETIIPANELQIMVPGATSKKVAIYWKPSVTTRPAASGRGGQVSFGGGAGSCGFVSNGGGDGSLGLPLRGYSVGRGFSSYHSGIDLAASTGTPVFAAGTGTIIFAGFSDWGYGYAIVIAHTPDLWTLYGHLSSINVGCGQTVPRGSQIGAVGSTGNSTGPHLHFEVRVGGDPVNPVTYLGGF